ncbi:MAG: hypothetical protein ACI9E1_001994 [Cryomorphaceae bacterium]|jgi:hypothetical protein
MKSIITLMKWSSCLLLTTGTLTAQQTIEERQQRAQQVDLFYNMAVRAYEDGDAKAAREALRSALALNRSHAHSIALARRMQTGGNQNVLAKRKRIFSSVMVPLIDLNEASVKDAISILAKNVETQSKGKVIPNFIIQDRGKQFDEVKITIKLKNVPAGDVLDHLLRSSGASASFGKYTTIIRPRGNAVVKKSSSKKSQKVENKEE